MMTVTLQKIATITEEFANGTMSVGTHKHKELSSLLASHNEVVFSYSFGMEAKRVKQIQALGFELKETIFYNSDAPHSTIKQVWARV